MGSGRAESVDLSPVADTTLHALNPTFNMGGELYFSMGATSKETRARALLKFDPAAVIPTNATITNVVLEFHLPSLNRIDTTTVDYEFYRLLVDWGEGRKTGNTGSLATAGEATWNSPINSTPWSAPGAGQGSDYSSTASMHGNLGPAPGTNSMPSTFRLTQDVQSWLNTPSQNFGWIGKAVDETVIQSAKRFSSRESGNGTILHVEFSVPEELRLTKAISTNGGIFFEWTGGRPPYMIVSSTNLLSGDWSLITTAFSGTNAFFLAPDDQRYFRVRELQ